MCVSATAYTTSRCWRPSGRLITISSPDLISRCGLEGWPFTSTLPALHAFCASERVRNRQATSSQMSNRTESMSRVQGTGLQGTGLHDPGLQRTTSVADDRQLESAELQAT